jgi:hypothetical protein
MKIRLRTVSVQLALGLFFCSVVNQADAQTKPAAAKQSTAKPAAAKTATAKPAAAKSSKPTAAKKSAAKPATSTTPTGTSGQAVTSKPVPVKTSSPPNQSQGDTPKKTATSPTNDYKAVEQKKAAPKSGGQKAKVYGAGFSKGDKLLNVGVGLSSYYYGTPIGVSFEAGVHKDISVGGQLDYNSGRYNDYYYASSHWGYKAYYLGVRGSYHFNRLLKIRSGKVDLYAGVGLGYQSFRWNDSGYGYGYDYRSGIFPNYFVGGKFYFVPKVAAFAELGYTGLSSSRVGIAFKF